MRATILFLSLLPLAACAAGPQQGPAPLVPVPVTIVAQYPHDRYAFTQGLLFHDGRLFESTGRYGHSALREVALESGEVLVERRLRLERFGEDITAVDGRIIQLTWRNRTALVYDADTLERTGSHRYRGEGWGLTHDGDRLVLSDGTDVLRFHDPGTFEETGTLAVRADGEPLADLNAMQFYEGRILANVWRTTWIAEIDPADGRVVALHDLAPLLERLDFTPRLDVESPNGIAYDESGGRLFVTGKLWPWLFEIELGGAGDE